jgi:hypothetical protein
MHQQQGEYMKKMFLAIIILIAAAYGAFAQNSSPNGAGVIQSLTGDVQIKTANASAFTAAGVGTQIARDTIVSTGFRSTAVIAIGNSVITVQPLTRLTLAEIQSSQETETINIDLQAGRVRVEVTPPAGARADFTVQTPSATASVRGTSFEIDADTITVYEGTVTYSGTSGTAAMVNIGRTSFVQTDGRPADPISIAANTILPSAPVGSTGTPTGTDTKQGHSLTVDIE